MDVLVFARHPGGGIRTYIYYVYGHSSMAGHDIHLLTPATDGMDALLDGLPNCRSHIQAGSSLSDLFRRLWRTLRELRPQLVHSHGFTAGLLASLPCRLLGVPHVITTHDVFLEDQFPGIKGKLKRWLIGRVLNLATVINPVGEDARDNLVKAFPYLQKNRKVVAIRNGIKTEAFLTPDTRDVRAEGKVPNSALLVGYFGRFMAQKGFRTLVDAVEEWNNRYQGRPLHVACFGWGGFIREEQEALRARNLDQYFHFFPSTDEMASALRGVDAVVMPSRWEACPLLPMEAMVAGVPVIGSDCIGLNEVAKNTPTLLFQKGSVSGLLERLAELEAQEAELKKIATEFRPEAAQRFDVSHTAVALDELYAIVR